jgi:CPA2 family monovalent cation:H+ antiporter-2
MVLTPVLVRLGPHFAAGMSKLNPLERAFGTRGADDKQVEELHLRDHVIIAGFGLGGRTLAGALKALRIPYIILDLNPATVDHQRREGEPIFYGDVTSPEVLNHLNCSHAREIVFVISDPGAARRAISAVRQYDPNLHITVRTRYWDEVEELKRLGATDVVVEEFENAVELMARVLRRFGTPRNVIAARIADARESRAELVRPLTIPRQRLEHFADVLREVKVDSYLIGESDWAVRRTCQEIDLRHATGASMVAIRRDGKIIPNPSPREQLAAGDVVYLLGDQPSVTAAMQFFGTGQAPKPPEPPAPAAEPSAQPDA